MRFFRQSILVAALVGVAAAVPAFAQQASQYPAPCDASKVSKADVDRAHMLYLSGKQFLDESNYEKAISYFKDAYSIDCSVHAILPIIATAYERKGDKLEAIHALEEYLKRAPTASDREVIERRIGNLKAQLPPPPTTTATTPPPPSTTAITPSAPPSVSATATPGPSATAPPYSTSEPPPVSGHGHSVAPWVVVGVGGAAAISGVVLFLVGAGKVNDAANKCPNHQCPPGDTADVDEGNNGRTLEAVGGTLFGVGLGAVAGGLIWHFVEPTSPTTGLIVTPSVAPGYAGLSAVARF
jgi:tetratricopeptide (TPR) repeat protein